jgi:hypothetical protein
MAASLLDASFIASQFEDLSDNNSSEGSDFDEVQGGESDEEHILSGKFSLYGFFSFN